MKRPHRLIAILGFLVLLAAGCQTAQEQATPTPIPTPIVAERQKYTVQRGRVQRIQEFNARVSPVVEEELFFEKSGYVDKVYVSRNDMVQAGDLIADMVQEAAVNQLAQVRVTLEQAELALQQAVQANERALAEAEASLETKKLRLESFRNQAPDPVDQVLQELQETTDRQIRESEINLEVKRIKLDQFKMQTPDNQIAIAQKRLEEARIRRDNAQAAYDAVSWKPGVEATAAATNLQSATIAYEIAQATYEDARVRGRTYQLDLTIMGKDYELAQSKHQTLVDSVSKQLADAAEQAQAKVDAYNLELSIMERDYELAELRYSYLKEGVDPKLAMSVQQARLNVERLETEVNKGQVASPIDGMVTTLAVTEGRTVDAFRRVAVIAAMDELELSAQLSDAEMQELEVGIPVTVTLGAYPGAAFIATITEMPYPYARGGSTTRLDLADPFTHIQLDDPDVELRMGDVAKISVLLDQAHDTLWLAPAAIRSFEGRNFVVVEQDGRQRRIDIKVGIQGRDRIEVLEGLEEGDIIVGQ